MAVYPVSLPNRGFLRLRGADKHFLQGIISQDIELLQTQTAIYACLLTPQGKFLHDFFVINLGEDWLIDGAADRLDDLQKRLTQFRMRHKVEIINETEKWQIYVVNAGEDFSQIAECTKDNFAFERLTEFVNSFRNSPGISVIDDPRHIAMGQRIYNSPGINIEHKEADYWAYECQRISLSIPDGSRDMAPEQALPMEFRLHPLNGISLSKGCYLGQEMCSRMFFRDLLKRQTYTLQFADDAPPAGTAIQNIAGQVVGEVRSSIGRLALGLIKIETAEAITPIALLANGQTCNIFTESH